MLREIKGLRIRPGVYYYGVNNRPFSLERLEDGMWYFIQSPHNWLVHWPPFNTKKEAEQALRFFMDGRASTEGRQL